MLPTPRYCQTCDLQTVAPEASKQTWMGSPPSPPTACKKCGGTYHSDTPRRHQPESYTVSSSDKIFMKINRIAFEGDIEDDDNDQA